MYISYMKLSCVHERELHKSELKLCFVSICQFIYEVLSAVKEYWMLKDIYEPCCQAIPVYEPCCCQAIPVYEPCCCQVIPIYEPCCQAIPIYEPCCQAIPIYEPCCCQAIPIYLPVTVCLSTDLSTCLSAFSST